MPEMDIPITDGYAVDSAELIQPPIENGGPVEPAPWDQPVQLSEDEKSEFMSALNEVFTAARSSRTDVDKNLEYLRKIINLQEFRAPAYDGAPNVVTPLIAERASSIAAEAWKAIDKEPLFVAVPKTAAANRAAPVWEAFMTQSLESSGSLREIKAAVFEACKMPAVALDVEVVENIAVGGDTGTEYEVRAVAVPIERFYVYPTGTRDMRLVSTFRYDPKPRWFVEAIAENGYYDLEAAKRAIADYTRSPGQTIAGIEDAGGGDNEMVAVWRSWFRYKWALWYVVFTGNDTVEELLRAEPDFIGLGRPPQVMITPSAELASIVGLSPTMMLRAYQDIQDATYNSMLVEAEFNTAPPAFTRDMALYREVLEKGWGPGHLYLTRLPVTEENLRFYTPRMNQASLGLLQLNESLAEKAVPSSPHLPVGGRKSAYEASVWASAGTARLSVLISNIKDGLEEFADVYWRVLREFKISGIAEVYPNSPDDVMKEAVFYIATKDIKIDLSDIEGLPDRIERAVEILMQMGIPPELGRMLAEQVVRPEVIKYEIPGAYRRDISWKLNGTATEVERAMQQQSFMLVMQTVNLIPVARQDRGVWELLRGLYQASGVTSWRNILGDPPQYADDELLMQLMPALQQIQNQMAGTAGVPVQQGGG